MKKNLNYNLNPDNYNKSKCAKVSKIKSSGETVSKKEISVRESVRMKEESIFALRNV